MSITKKNEKLLPIELRLIGSKYYIICLNTPSTDLKEPFFIDSLKYQFDLLTPVRNHLREAKMLVQPLHYKKDDSRIIKIPIDRFVREYRKNPNKKFIGFIFHTSRCGSTLITQMLSQKFQVFSEPTIINSVLDLNLNLSLSKRMILFKSVINALEVWTKSDSNYFFIKFRSWNTLYINEILQMFPNSRWLFIHRNSLEIMPSLLEKPSGWLRSYKTYPKFFMDVLNMTKKQIRTMKKDEFSARILGLFCRKAYQAKSENSYFLDYKDIKNLFFGIIQKLWSVDLSSFEIKRMTNISQYYSKDVRKTKIFNPKKNTKKRENLTEIQKKYCRIFTENERTNLIN